MRILYVGDNSDRLNWGCRATSISMYQLLAKQHDIADIVSGSEIQTPINWSPLWPQRLHRKLLSPRLHGVPLLASYLRIERILGAEHDLLDQVPATSADRFVQWATKVEFLRSLLERIERADAIVINGEGDMIFATPARRKLLFLLALMEVAHRLGVPVHYHNAMISECPVSGLNAMTKQYARESLKRCESVTVRDFQSARFLRAHMPEVKHTMVPDALFAWADYFPNVDGTDSATIAARPFFEGSRFANMKLPDRRYVVVSGGSYAARYPRQSVESYGGLVDGLRKIGLDIVLAIASSADTFLNDVGRKLGVAVIPAQVPIMAAGAILSNATLLVSGRYHPSILASLGGTPCVFLGSNSHKTLSLQELLEYESPLEFDPLPDQTVVRDIVDHAADAIKQGPHLRNRLARVAGRLRQEVVSEYRKFNGPP